MNEAVSMTMEVILASHNDFFKSVGGLAHRFGIIYNFGSYPHWVLNSEDQFMGFLKSLIYITNHEFLHYIGHQTLGRSITHDEIAFIENHGCSFPSPFSGVRDIRLSR